MKRALDLFCCAGGATRGLQLAGYHVTGVDIEPQPHYCGNAFVQDDAMAWLRGERGPLGDFDLVWASPPCQRYSEATPPAYKDSHPDLLPEVCKLLREQDTPYIIENVEMAKHLLHSPVMLCGSMFGLNFWRHRYFEIGNCDVFFLTSVCDHSFAPILITGQPNRLHAGIRERRATIAEKRAAMGVDWMTGHELSESIPPAYSRFLAEQIDRTRQ